MKEYHFYKYALLPLYVKLTQAVLRLDSNIAKLLLDYSGTGDK